MDPETFILRKQFLDEFYNEDRIKFLRACRRINIKNDHLLNSLHDRVFLFETEVIFNLEICHLFENFCNLIKPFVYFLYSITYHKKFLRGHLLFFNKLEVQYSKSAIEEREIGDYTVYFDISNGFLPPDCEDFKFLKTIKIKDFLNGSVKRLTYLNVKLKTKYLNISRSEYRFLGGIGNTINYADMSDINDNEEAMNEDKIINSTKTFYSKECIICLTNQPIILFCNCGHLCCCSECYKLKSLSTCPICKTENDIIRMLE